MNKRSFHLSPGAPSLILIVVVLSMSIMGMLMFIRTQNDMRLSDRSIQVAQADGALFDAAEETYAGLDALAAACKKEAVSDEDYLAAVENALDEEMELDGRVIYWTESRENRDLYAAVYLNPLESEERLTWHSRILDAEVGKTWNEF